MPEQVSGALDSAERFFAHVTGFPPYGYQRRLAERSNWPDLMDVPTGLGKTAAVVVSWLWKRLHSDAQTGRRLVYCLPMRTLVEQTHAAAATWCRAAAPFFEEHGLEPPQASILMGGETEAPWDLRPSGSRVIVGTQDMLLSRALCRGYGMSRYRWPMHFGLLNSDCLWVFDETQLMGVGVETSAQLHAFRQAMGTMGPARSLWMSATLGQEQLATVDHPEPAEGWAIHTLSSEEREKEGPVRERTLARKRVIRAEHLALASEPDHHYYRRVAETVAGAAERGELTLVVVNRVARAQGVYRALRTLLGEQGPPCALLHSRFRGRDREHHRKLLDAQGDRIVVSTQVVEAGVDVSARTLFTELAPWPSLVQRFGRCNRYGEAEDEAFTAEIHWIPLGSQDGAAGLALPYDASELERAAVLLEKLVEQGGDAGPEALRSIPYEAPAAVRPALRRRDLLDLFDTSPDLLGYDLDISRFIRDADDHDAQFFWRQFKSDSGRPPADLSEAHRDELCRVSVREANSFVDALHKLRRRFESGSKENRERAPLLWGWKWDSVAKRWEPIQRRGRVRPGEVLLLHASAEGYDPDLGWTGETIGKGTVPDLAGDGPPAEGMDADPSTDAGRWVKLTDHLAHVEDAVRDITPELSLDPAVADALATAARWHDVGKAHDDFQRRLLAPLEEHTDMERPGPGLWAKSNHRSRAKGVRPYFRHELASALAWLAHQPDGDPRHRDLVAFLIAAHHGKVRVALRSIPGEREPETPEALYARGIWDGDVLPAVDLPDGRSLPPTRLNLSPMRMGEGSWAERLLALRDDDALGPFRLAYLESLLRSADESASRAESMDSAEEGGNA